MVSPTIVAGFPIPKFLRESDRATVVRQVSRHYFPVPSSSETIGHRPLRGQETPHSKGSSCQHRSSGIGFCPDDRLAGLVVDAYFT